MPRRARVFQAALCYHVMNRGINRHEIFADDEDREAFSRLVREYRDACGAKVYHWAWMSTHYHMLIEIVYENLRAFVGGFQQCYAQYHHSRHDGCGFFWQGRFKSTPVEVGEYLGRCGRYIERNPVRTGIVDDAWDYRWSSAAHYVRNLSDGLTDFNTHLGPMDDGDRRSYAQILMSGVDDSLMSSHSYRGVVGSDTFASRLQKHSGRYRRVRGRPVKVVRING